MNMDSILSQCEAEGIKLSVKLADTLDVYCSKKMISYDLKDKLKLYKSELINHLRESNTPSLTGHIEFLKSKTLKVSANNADIVKSDKAKNGGIEPKQTESSFSRVNPPFEVLVEEIAKYKNVLEKTYLDEDNDEWHGDGIGQKFRLGDHTDDDIKAALARFIERVHHNEKETKDAVIAFLIAQEALLEHQRYFKMLKWPVKGKLRKEIEYNNEDLDLAWQRCKEAYKKMPEHKAFINAKKRQALFAPLLDKPTTQKRIECLVGSIS